MLRSARSTGLETRAAPFSGLVLACHGASAEHIDVMSTPVAVAYNTRGFGVGEPWVLVGEEETCGR